MTAGLGTFMRWFLLGAGIIAFAGLALVHLQICARLSFWEHYAEPLAYAVVSGGIALGLLAVAIRWAWRAARERPGS